MSSLIDLLIECWMVDDVLLSDSDFIILMVYMVIRFEIPRMSYMNTRFFDEIPRMSYMNTRFFDARLIGLEVPDLAQLVFGCGSQPYENY